MTTPSTMCISTSLKEVQMSSVTVLSPILDSEVPYLIRSFNERIKYVVSISKSNVLED